MEHVSVCVLSPVSCFSMVRVRVRPRARAIVPHPAWFQGHEHCTAIIIDMPRYIAIKVEEEKIKLHRHRSCSITDKSRNTQIQGYPKWRKQEAYEETTGLL